MKDLLQRFALMLAMAYLAVAGSAQTGQKVIKDAAEYKVYMAALDTQDPAQKAAAMEAFVQQYPASVVKVDALEQAMGAYQQAGNQAKVQDAANRILDLDPKNVRALAIATFIKRALATQGDAKAAGDLRGLADRGLQELPQWAKPEEMKDAEFDKLKNQMAGIFNGAAGFAALQAKDFGGARGYYLKSFELEPNNLQDVYQLGLACLESNPIDKQGFWYIAKASNLAAGNPQAQKAIGAYGASKYRHYHGSADGWNQILSAAATQAAPPADFADSVKAAPTPAELAVAAVKDNDPATLSFADWEYILEQRDASPANKEAAERVWQVIRQKEQNGEAKLAIPVKVISATKTTIQAAITGDNQKAGKSDLEITMEKPLVQAPAPGAQITVIGVISDYRPSPFAFVMEQGEIKATAQKPAAKPAPKRPAKARAKTPKRGV